MSVPQANRHTGGTLLSLPFGLRFGFWACQVVGVAIVLRRLLALRATGLSSLSSAPPDLAKLDAWFQAHATLTHVHILTALAFLCLLPLVFWRRTQHSSFLRTAFYSLGAAVAVTAYAMSAYSVGGWVERTAVLVFNTWFLASLGASLFAWRNGMAAAEQRWTLRSVATVLGIATTRPVMGIFFATARITHWTPQQFFGPAFWIGFAINVIAMEWWLSEHPTPSEGAG